MMQVDATVNLENTLVIRSELPSRASAHIYRKPLEAEKIFMCGDFTVEEVQEVLAKHRKFNDIKEDSLLKEAFKGLVESVKKLTIQMSVRVKGTSNSVDCTSIRDEKSVAFIWKSEKYKGLTFFCGDFNIREVELILEKMKEEAIK